MNTKTAEQPADAHVTGLSTGVIATVTEAAATAKSGKKKWIPAYEFRVRVLLPLDKSNMSATMAAAEQAMKDFKPTLPEGAAFEFIGEPNPLGKMEAVKE